VQEALLRTAKRGVACAKADGTGSSLSRQTHPHIGDARVHIRQDDQAALALPLVGSGLTTILVRPARNRVGVPAGGGLRTIAAHKIGRQERIEQEPAPHHTLRVLWYGRHLTAFVPSLLLTTVCRGKPLRGSALDTECTNSSARCLQLDSL